VGELLLSKRQPAKTGIDDVENSTPPSTAEEPPVKAQFKMNGADCPVA
jgi:hypothetical protein